jgi:Zn-dependent membrane protease YugP
VNYWLLIIVTLALGLGASAYVNSQLKKYSKVASSSGITGREAAERMLRANGVVGVSVYRGQEGQDHFDPRTNSISLSPSVYDRSTVTAYATACHEVGHACQFATGYTPMKVRSALVPAVNFTANTWIFILLIGIALNSIGLVDLAIAFYAVAVIFSIVTLPVEFNASSRALQYMSTIGLPQYEVSGSGSVLRACAFTYLASTLISVLQLLYLLSMRDN